MVSYNAHVENSSNQFMDMIGNKIHDDVEKGDSKVLQADSANLMS